MSLNVLFPQCRVTQCFICVFYKIDYTIFYLNVIHSYMQNNVMLHIYQMLRKDPVNSFKFDPRLV